MASAMASLIYLGEQENDEIQQDVARSLANITANEENHVPAFEQGALNCFVALPNSSNDILLLI